MNAREQRGSAGQLPSPGAAGKPRPTGGSPPGAAPPPVSRPAPATGRSPPLRRRGDRAHARLTGPSDSRRASSRRERSPSRARPRARPRKRGRPLTLIFHGKTPAPIRRTDQTRPRPLLSTEDVASGRAPPRILQSRQSNASVMITDGGLASSILSPCDGARTVVLPLTTACCCACNAHPGVASFKM